jgi:hypothetical protein
MAHLGVLSPDLTVDGLDDAPELDTFEWFGEVFTVAPNLSALAILRFAWDTKAAEGQERRGQLNRRRARTDTERGEAEELIGGAAATQMSAAYGFLKSVIGPGEWPRFEEVTDLACANEDTLGELITALVGVITARPTRQPSASAGGLSTTGPSSQAASPSPVSVTAKERQDAELFYAVQAV